MLCGRSSGVAEEHRAQRQGSEPALAGVSLRCASLLPGARAARHRRQARISAQRARRRAVREWTPTPPPAVRRIDEGAGSSNRQRGAGSVRRPNGVTAGSTARGVFARRSAPAPPRRPRRPSTRRSASPSTSNGAYSPSRAEEGERVGRSRGRCRARGCCSRGRPPGPSATSAGGRACTGGSTLTVHCRPGKPSRRDPSRRPRNRSRCRAAGGAKPPGFGCDGRWRPRRDRERRGDAVAAERLDEVDHKPRPVPPPCAPRASRLWPSGAGLHRRRVRRSAADRAAPRPWRLRAALADAAVVSSAGSHINQTQRFTPRPDRRCSPSRGPRPMRHLGVLGLQEVEHAVEASGTAVNCSSHWVARRRLQSSGLRSRSSPAPRRARRSKWSGGSAGRRRSLPRVERQESRTPLRRDCHQGRSARQVRGDDEVDAQKAAAAVGVRLAHLDAVPTRGGGPSRGVRADEERRDVLYAVEGAADVVR